MKKRKIFTIIGTLGAFSTTAFSVSCSTTWTHWESKNVDPHKINYDKYHPKNAARNFPEAYIIRDIVKNNDTQKAADKSYTIDPKDPTKATINLNNINNLNELIYIFGKVLNISLNDDIDSYWANMTDADTSNHDQLLQYIKRINQKMDITLQLGANSTVIHWDMGNTKTDTQTAYDSAMKIIKPGLTDYLNALKTVTNKGLWSTPSSTAPKGIKQDAWDIHWNKLFDVQIDGLNSDNQPADLGEVAKVGSPLANHPVVAPLLSADVAFSLRLGKLTNLSKDMFNGFIELLNKFNDFLNQVNSDATLKTWHNILTLKDNHNKLMFLNGKLLKIQKKVYNLNPIPVNGKGQPNSGLNGSSQSNVLIAKFMLNILKKDN